MEVKRLEEETILIRLLLKINFSIESIANCYAQNKKNLKKTFVDKGTCVLGVGGGRQNAEGEEVKWD